MAKSFDTRRRLQTFHLPLLSSFFPRPRGGFTSRPLLAFFPAQKNVFVSVEIASGHMERGEGTEEQKEGVLVEKT